ncbi:MAG TPA: carboxypeptidase regulatory-like domain-containing protein, partial [Polyangia bacterium]|nr:carboxypeptidase regulatory-like domain-containing protein [Polyangia bacterium]
RRYADNGGRIFDEHLNSYWISHGLPPWPTTAAWQQSVASDPPTPLPATVNVSFPKGAALADWLQSVGATTARGQLSLVMAQHSVDAVTPPTQLWISSASPATTQYLTFNTPVEAPAAAQCGRVVFTDVHVGTGGGSSAPGAPGFPSLCSTNLTMSAQEKALEFMFFDLSSCVQVDTTTPQTPPIPPLGGTTPPPPIP